MQRMNDEPRNESGPSAETFERERACVASSSQAPSGQHDGRPTFSLVRGCFVSVL